MAKRTSKTKASSKTKTVKPTSIIDPNELTPQMLLFINHYIVCMNGTQAARLAEYTGDDATLAATASRLLRNDKVLRELDSRLATFTMSANEALVRLTDIARSDIGDVLNSAGGIDPLEAKNRGKSHLIKRFKTKTVTTEDSDISEAEVEMYDAQAALNTLLKFYGLLVDRVKVDDWRSDLIALLKEGKATREQIQMELGDELAQEFFNSPEVRSINAGEGGEA